MEQLLCGPALTLCQLEAKPCSLSLSLKTDISFDQGLIVPGFDPDQNRHGKHLLYVSPYQAALLLLHQEVASKSLTGKITCSDWN